MPPLGTYTGMHQRQGDASMAGIDVGGGETFSSGHPASPADASQTIQSSMKDSFSYEPSSITVQSGETVAFEVTNDGTVTHYAVGMIGELAVT